MRSAIVLALLLGGCCNEGEPCAQNDVYVLVTQGDAPVAGVTIDGYDFTCTEGETFTVCRPSIAIADGDYDLVVNAPGQPSREVALAVRTRAVPQYSCDCRIPTASVTIEYEPLTVEPDAGL